jgi:hypothetical protein
LKNLIAQKKKEKISSDKSDFFIFTPDSRENLGGIDKNKNNLDVVDSKKQQSSQKPPLPSVSSRSDKPSSSSSLPQKSSPPLSPARTNSPVYNNPHPPVSPLFIDNKSSSKSPPQQPSAVFASVAAKAEASVYLPPKNNHLNTVDGLNINFFFIYFSFFFNFRRC